MSTAFSWMQLILFGTETGLANSQLDSAAHHTLPQFFPQCFLVARELCTYKGSSATVQAAPLSIFAFNTWLSRELIPYWGGLSDRHCKYRAGMWGSCLEWTSGQSGREADTHMITPVQWAAPKVLRIERKWLISQLFTFLPLLLNFLPHSLCFNNWCLFCRKLIGHLSKSSSEAPFIIILTVSRTQSTLTTSAPRSQCGLLDLSLSQPGFLLNARWVLDFPGLSFPKLYT